MEEHCRRPQSEKVTYFLGDSDSDNKQERTFPHGFLNGLRNHLYPRGGILDEQSIRNCLPSVCSLFIAL